MALATVFMLVLAASAQQPASGTGTGEVTGQVIAQDTQRPARWVVVDLLSVAAAHEARMPGGHPVGGSPNLGVSVITRTDAEGSFTAVNLAPGDYYVIAQTRGYLVEPDLLETAVSAGADPAALLAQIPVVHVAANSTSSITVTMERGATISGRVQWEDGSPVAGVQLRAIPTVERPALPALLARFQSLGGTTGSALTDDRGGFRITELPAGDYLLRCEVPSAMQVSGTAGPIRYSSPIVIYSPGVFHKADAKSVSVTAGDERGDVRMVFDLRGLHTVSGHAVSGDASENVASGLVTLVDANDSELQLIGSILANGDFAIRYVPPGSYTLQVTGASTQSSGSLERGSSQGVGVSFQPLSQPVTVTDRDVTGVAVTLTPVQNSP